MMLGTTTSATKVPSTQRVKNTDHRKHQQNKHSFGAGMGPDPEAIEAMVRQRICSFLPKKFVAAIGPAPFFVPHLLQRAAPIEEAVRLYAQAPHSVGHRLIASSIT
eukprot:184954-Amphidinium_carterae.1